MFFFFREACLLSIFFLGLQYQTILAQNRIIGGSETTIEKFPYMLRLEVPRKTDNLISICGASIISEEWGLTAAHCFNPENADLDNARVIAGTANLVNMSETAQIRKISQIIVHEDWKGLWPPNQTYTADIAVFKIASPLAFNKAIQPIKLPEKGQELRSGLARIAGWGYTKPGGVGPSILRTVTVPRIPTPICAAEYYHAAQIRIKEGEICYGLNLLIVTLDICQGDSGGPLVNLDGIELGIVSWTAACGTRGFPSVYTEVQYYRDWIKEKSGI